MQACVDDEDDGPDWDFDCETDWEGTLISINDKLDSEPKQAAHESVRRTHVISYEEDKCPSGQVYILVIIAY